MNGPIAAWVERHLASGAPVVLVTVSAARGSTPREAGTAMAVAATAAHGTIGGGRLEWEAIKLARTMLDDGRRSAQLDLPLGPAVGQCCGGHVLLDLVLADEMALDALKAAEADHHAGTPQVVLFGAGHVGTALAQALRPLPLRLTWSDLRPDIFPTGAADWATLDRDDQVEAARAAEPGAGLVILTHTHAGDYAIAEAALNRGDLAYVGMIGSQTKRRRFERWFVARGGDPAALDRLTSPIGGRANKDKRPAVIAAYAAAELLTAFARQADLLSHDLGTDKEAG